jgi:hypothetical protein
VVVIRSDRCRHEWGVTPCTHHRWLGALALLGALCLAAPARAQRAPGEGYVPSVHLATRLALREGTNVGSSFELGMQVLRPGGIELHVSAIYEPDRALTIPAVVRRSYSQYEGIVDLMLPVGAWVAVGPSASLAVRQYQQDWDPFFVPTPTAGARATLGLAGSRTWRLSLDGRTTVDLTWNRLVVGTAEVRTLSPVQLQVGLRFDIGAGLPVAEHR